MTAPIARLTATRLQGGEKIKRLCYLANLYRYEEIQAGRQCEFEQAGVEMLGASGAAADAEVIVLAAEALQAAGLQKFAISWDTLILSTAWRRKQALITRNCSS